MSRGVDEAWSADRGSNLGAVHFSKGFRKISLGYRAGGLVYAGKQSFSVYFERVEIFNDVPFVTCGDIENIMCVNCGLWVDFQDLRSLEPFVEC